MRRSTMILIPAAVLTVVAMLAAFRLFGLDHFGPAAGMLAVVLVVAALAVAQRERRS